MQEKIISNILNEFEIEQLEDWKVQVTKELKGKPLEGLDYVLNEEIQLAPYYKKAESTLNTSILTQHNQDWFIAERFDVIDNKINKDILNSLNAGTNALLLSVVSDGFIDFEEVLKGVELSYIHTYVFSDFISSVTLNSIDKRIKKSDFTNGLATVSLSLNFLEDSKEKQDVWVEIINNKKYSHSIYVAAEKYSENANIIDELVGVYSEVKETLKRLKKLGVSSTTFFSQLFVSMYIDEKYLISIAKIRALKMLLVDLMNEEGIEPKLPHILVGWNEKSYKEPKEENLIRATTMAMSAAIGGANTIEVLPIDQSKTAKRWARNIQLILKHESGLHLAPDPALGSYWLETLTYKIYKNVLKNS